MSIGRARKICDKIERAGLPLKKSVADCWQGFDVLRQNRKDKAAALFRQEQPSKIPDTNLSQKAKPHSQTSKESRCPKRPPVQPRPP